MKEIMKGRKKDAPIKPPAELEARPGDYELPPVLFLACGVFKRLKVKPSTDKFPGTLRLRSYTAQEVICWQGDPGWSAFAILSADDVTALRTERDRLVAELPKKIHEARDAAEKFRAANKPDDVVRKQEEAEKAEELFRTLQSVKLPEAPPGTGSAATVWLDTSRSSVTRSRGWWSRLFSRSPKPTLQPVSISIDAPTTVDYGKKTASLPEGSLFGQWSCIYGTPRSATIAADRPIYVLEMLRNVLEQILRDKQFQEDSDREYVDSVLRNHLAGLPIFRQLTPEQLEEIRAGVSLRRCVDGEVIFNRGDPSDSMYIVRRGVVKVLLDRDKATGSENILRYLTQGDFFGEMGVILGQPRSAACVAYVHPRPEGEESDAEGERWRKEEERVELVEIPARLVHQLRDKYPSIRGKLDAVIARHRQQDQSRQLRSAWSTGATPQQSDRFQSLGLIQGQKLMLIDLERCTRCDECVEACVAQHDDGRTRLFLDGPRYGRFLVPTSCRACRDPVCMIGCPVGSIRRGDNLQIVIEDWCIGCQLCAKNCPYGSIQMHDLGLIQEATHDWRWQYRSRLSGEAWTKPGFVDVNWTQTTSPIWWDQDWGNEFDDPQTLCFRRAFRVDQAIPEDGGVKIVLESIGKEIVFQGSGKQARPVSFLPVWLNGERFPVDGWRQERGRKDALNRERPEYVLELKGPACQRLVRRGRNVIAVEATGVAGQRGVLLQLAIDEIQPSGAVIPLRAVVCDQCSDTPSREPACVHACPHDAAMRIDAWTQFPA